MQFIHLYRGEYMPKTKDGGWILDENYLIKNIVEKIKKKRLSKQNKPKKKNSNA